MTNTIYYNGRCYAAVLMRGTEINIENHYIDYLNLMQESEARVWQVFPVKLTST